MKRISAILTVSILSFSICDRTDVTHDNNNNNNNNNNKPNTAPDLVNILQISDAKGAFVGVMSVSEQSTPMGNITMTIGTAVAVVGDLTAGKYEDVGKVQCYVGSTPKAYELTKQDNNSYVFIPSMTDPTGIPYTQGSAGIPFWEVPSLNISTSSYYQFPSVPEITSSLTISKASGYEATVSGYDGAAEVLYSISSNGKSVHKIIKASDAEFGQKKAVFTASELSVLDNSDMALLQVAPYTIHDKVIDGNKYYFINEVAVTKSVKLQ